MSIKIQEELQKLLECDSHSKDGYYCVRSLYFDSIDDRDYYEKDAGIYLRRKIRLRIYDTNDTHAKLEIKAKEGDNQNKSSLILTREQARLLQEGEYSVLLDIDDELAYTLYTVMTLNVYRPVALIEYDRRAFVFDAFNIRITFDTNVRSDEINLDVYNEAPEWNYILNESVVLEVKYDGKLFEPIADLLKKYNLVQSSYSKYVSGREIINTYSF